MASTLTDIIYQLNQPITLPDITPALHKTKIIAQEISQIALHKTLPNTMMAYHKTPSKITTCVEHYTYLDGLTFDFVRALIYVHVARCALSFPEIYEYFKNL